MLAAAAAVGAEGVERFSHGTTIATNALLERKGCPHGVRRHGRVRAPASSAPAEPRASLPVVRRTSPAARSARGLPRRARADGARRRARAARPRLASGASTPRPSLSARSSRFAIRLTRRRSPMSCDGACRKPTSSPRTRSLRSFASTSGPRRRPPTRTSVRSCARYFRALASRSSAAGLPRPLVMRSSGGVIDAEEAAQHPAHVLVSGPAGESSARRSWRVRRESTRQSRSTWAGRPPTCA